MGNEPSSGLSPEQHSESQQVRARVRAETLADIERRKGAVRQRLKDEQRAKAVASKDAESNNDNGVEMAIRGDDHPSKVTRPLDASQEDGEILELGDGSGILQSFKPRKERGTQSARPAKRSMSGSLSDLPKIAKRSFVASPHSPSRADEVSTSSAAGQHERPPRWYRELTVKQSRGKNESNADTLLRRLRDRIRKCQTSAKKGAPPKDMLEQIRTSLHTIAFVDVNAQLLKTNRMLHDRDGLPQLFDKRYSQGVKWPFDIKADAKELYNKWARKSFETDLMRGIIFTPKSIADNKATDSVDPKYKINAKYHGNGDLLNGQWWPTQLCALRDGAHGVSQGGISGEKGDGAYSIVMSGGHEYADEDLGEELQYCGTDSKDSSVTEYTQRMVESVGNHPVRLIRSHNLDSPYAPKRGFRYDGLYDVVSYENLDGTNSERQRHRFKLVRRRGQDPIRHGQGAEGRPTAQEVAAYDKHRRLSGKDK